MFRLFIFILISIQFGTYGFANERVGAKSDRQEFRSLLTNLSTNSQSQPLKCDEKQAQGGRVHVQYTLT